MFAHFCRDALVFVCVRKCARMRKDRIEGRVVRVQVRQARSAAFETSLTSLRNETGRERAASADNKPPGEK